MRGTVVLSIVFHASLFVGGFVYSFVAPRFGGGWGARWGTGGAVRVGAVASLPGVPLPAPVVASRSTVATENPGLYRAEPKKEPEPEPKVEKVPQFKKTVTPEKMARVNPRIQKEELEMPDNAVPFGQGGRPMMAYSQFANPAGEGGLGFGEGNFGERYGWYVAAVRSRISNNWLLSTVSPSILTAPRVYLSFDVLRDGTIADPRIMQSSGIPEVDRSALRAVLASSPLGPLPPQYGGGKVTVQFYFDFHRR